jgi:hypothetical protein
MGESLWPRRKVRHRNLNVSLMEVLAAIAPQASSSRIWPCCAAGPVKAPSEFQTDRHFTTEQALPQDPPE